MNFYDPHRYQPIGSWQAIDAYWDEINGEAEAYDEYATVHEGVNLGYLCAMDGTPCEMETSNERYGEDADGNRGIWVTSTRCRKCHEVQP